MHLSKLETLIIKNAYVPIDLTLLIQMPSVKSFYVDKQTNLDSLSELIGFIESIIVPKNLEKEKQDLAKIKFPNGEITEYHSIFLMSKYKKGYLKDILIWTFLLTTFVSCQENEKSNLTLFSDQIPTDKALIFGQKVISTDNFEFGITFNPEMNELFFTRRKPDEDNKIYHMKLEDGKWSNPELAFFTSDEGWDFEPHISPKGDRLYFGSVRPLPDTVKPRGLYQWYCEKKEDNWGTPTPLEEPFTDKTIMYLTSTKHDNLYFTSGEEGDEPGDWVIYNAINEKGQYSSINRMGKAINFDGKYIAHPYISPDESYIIYDGESTSGYGDNDLYISFNKNGIWTAAVNLGPGINTDQTEMCPSVSPDGKYLFFHRGDSDNGDIYWADFTLIKQRFE